MPKAVLVDKVAVGNQIRVSKQAQGCKLWWLRFFNTPKTQIWTLKIDLQAAF